MLRVSFNSVLLLFQVEKKLPISVQIRDCEMPWVNVFLAFLEHVFIQQRVTQQLW